MIDDPKNQLKCWPLSKREETIDTIDSLLKIARAAQDVVKETSEHNPLWERVRTKYIVALTEALSVLPPVEDKEPEK